MNNRRDFLNTVLGCTVGSLGLPKLSSNELLLPQDGVKLDSTVLDIVKLLEETKIIARRSRA